MYATQAADCSPHLPLQPNLHSPGLWTELRCTICDLPMPDTSLDSHHDAEPPSGTGVFCGNTGVINWLLVLAVVTLIPATICILMSGERKDGSLASRVAASMQGRCWWAAQEGAGLPCTLTSLRLAHVCLLNPVPQTTGWCTCSIG